MKFTIVTPAALADALELCAQLAHAGGLLKQIDPAVTKRDPAIGAIFEIVGLIATAGAEFVDVATPNQSHS